MSNEAIEFHHAARKFYWALAIDDKYQDPADELEIPLSEFGADDEMTAEQVNDGLYTRALNQGKVVIEGEIYRIVGWCGFYTGYDLTRYFVERLTGEDLQAGYKLNVQELPVRSSYPF